MRTYPSTFWREAMKYVDETIVLGKMEISPKRLKNLRKMAKRFDEIEDENQGLPDDEQGIVGETAVQIAQRIMTYFIVALSRRNELHLLTEKWGIEQATEEEIIKMEEYVNCPYNPNHI